MCVYVPTPPPLYTYSRPHQPSRVSQSAVRALCEESARGWCVCTDDRDARGRCVSRRDVVKIGSVYIGEQQYIRRADISSHISRTAHGLSTPHPPTHTHLLELGPVAPTCMRLARSRPLEAVLDKLARMPRPHAYRLGHVCPLDSVHPCISVHPCCPAIKGLGQALQVGKLARLASPASPGERGSLHAFQGQPLLHAGSPPASIASLRHMLHASTEGRILLYFAPTVAAPPPAVDPIVATHW